MDEHTPRTRDAALRRLRSANRWLIAGSVTLTGVFAAVAANAFPGKTLKASGATTRTGTGKSGAKSHLRAPARSPQPGEQEGSTESSTEAEEATAPEKTVEAEKPPVETTEAERPVEEKAAEPEKTVEAEKPVEAERKVETQPEAPVVSGGS